MSKLYRLDTTARLIADHFNADAGDDPWAGGYVAPKRPGPVVTGGNGRSNGRRILPMLWGVPAPPQGHDPVTHVRNLSSPFWIGVLRHCELRCLIPVTAFQIWAGESGAKRQYWFNLTDQPIFAFAAIFRHTDDWPCFAILSCPPNRLIRSLTPATMPLIIHREDYECWLTADWRDAGNLVRPFPSEQMCVREMTPIDRKNP